MNSTDRIACITDCTDTNANGRMQQEVHYECQTPFSTMYHAEDMIEAGGNMVDAMRRSDGILCNSAPRENEKENGSDIAFGKVRGRSIVSTLYALPLFRKVFPEVDRELQILDIKAFLERVDRLSELQSQYRGQTVMPMLLSHVLRDQLPNDIARPVDGFIAVIDSPAVWLVDQIKRRPTNVKLTTLRSELKASHGEQVTVEMRTRRGKDRKLTMTFYNALADIPYGQVGVYRGSSGYGDERFLEIAEKGGSAAIKFGLKVGDEVDVRPLGDLRRVTDDD